MPLSDTNDAGSEIDAAQLARLLDTATGDKSVWLPRDLPGLLRHQWLAPVEFDLTAGPEENAEETVHRAGELQIRTFADLLQHPEPPLALLKLAKDFFKRQAKTAAENQAEGQVAYVFYLLIILAAKSRCGAEISGLPAVSLKKSVDWALAQAWLKEEPRQILAALSFGLAPS